MDDWIEVMSLLIYFLVNNVVAGQTKPSIILINIKASGLMEIRYFKTQNLTNPEMKLFSVGYNQNSFQSKTENVFPSQIL